MAFIIKAPVWRSKVNTTPPADNQPTSTPTAPARSLVGPEDITGTVRDWLPAPPVLQGGFVRRVRLWNDPMGRTFSCESDEIIKAFNENKSITCTVEKLRGRWTITEVKRA